MRFNIVKQSDVSFGTALHYALDWTYGHKALCGRQMRSTARDGEIGYKRVCGSCAKIMAGIVEDAHAEALREQNPEQKIEAEVKAIAATLKPAMIEGLTLFGRTGEWGNTRIGTQVALLERGLVGHSRRGIKPDQLTELGDAVLNRLDETSTPEAGLVSGANTYRVTCAPTHDHPAGRSWTVRAENAGAAQERVCTENNLTWSHIHAGLVSTVLVDAAEQENLDCPPVCEHGSTEDEGCTEGECVQRSGNAFLLGTEYNFVIDFEQEFADSLRARGVSFSRAQEAARALRRGSTNVTLAVRQSDELLTEYDRLRRKHGSAIPFVVRDKAPQPVTTV